MINYYKLLNISSDASKHKTFRAFKKRYLSETRKEVKIDLLTGFLLVANERQKFLDILLKQHESKKELTPKYEAVIAYERRKAESVINSPTNEEQLRKALKVYPLKEAISGVFWFFFFYITDKYYFEFSYLLILLGTILIFQSNLDIFWRYLGFSLILLGIYVHIRIVRNVKIRKIIKITAYNNP